MISYQSHEIYDCVEALRVLWTDIIDECEKYDDLNKIRSNVFQKIWRKPHCWLSDRPNNYIGTVGSVQTLNLRRHGTVYRWLALRTDERSLESLFDYTFNLFRRRVIVFCDMYNSSASRCVTCNTLPSIRDENRQRELVEYFPMDNGSRRVDL